MLTWRYPPPYDRYDLDADPSDVDLMRSGVGGDRWFAVDDAVTEPAAFFEFVGLEDRTIEIGLGLRPDLTGRGLGATLIEEGLRFARRRWGARSFALDVYPWNDRAIRAYEKAGFIRGEVYTRRFEDGRDRKSVV